MVSVRNDDFPMDCISYQKERRQLAPQLDSLLILFDMTIADPEQ